MFTSELNVDLNELLPTDLRNKLNSQPLKIRNRAVYDSDGTIRETFIYVMGLGEKHYKAFDKEIVKIIAEFPWTKRKQIRFIMNELIINSQFSMLRELVARVKDGKKAPGYFNVVMYISNDFFSASIEEFGDFFDYYGYLDTIDSIDYSNPDMYDTVDETVIKDISSLHENHIKLVLSSENDLYLADASNRIGLNVIEKATDQDFYVTSFYKNGRYMWKRIYFRVENN
jgi:hypothetical protein